MGSGLRTGWLILGILLLLIVLSEAGLRLALTAKDQLARQSRTEYRIDERAGSGPYREQALDATNRYVWQPYVYWRHPSYQGRHIRVDRNGRRATWNPPPQRTTVAGPPPVRIFAFGASTMWGSDVRDDHTIASYLSKLLYARGYRAQVTNYGQLGYVSTQAAILLLRGIHRGEIPDIVLLYDGVNDLIASHTHGEGVAFGDTRRGPGMDRPVQRRPAVEPGGIGKSPFSDSAAQRPRDGLLRHREAVAFGDTRRGPGMDRPVQWRPAVERDGLLRHSHGAAGVSVNEWLRRAEFDLLNRPQGLLEHTGRQLLTKGFWGFNRLRVSLRRRIRSAPEDRSRSRPLGEELARRTLHVYAANLAAVESLGRRYGFEPLFYWQPNIFSKRHRSPREQAAARRLLLSEKVYDDLYRRVRRSGILNNHPRFHDISGLFDHREEPYYVDMWHLSEAGNRLVAEEMVEDVIALIEQRRAAAAEEPAT